MSVTVYDVEQDKNRKYILKNASTRERYSASLTLTPVKTFMW